MPLASTRAFVSFFPPTHPRAWVAGLVVGHYLVKLR
jgi:hypothetical protein